MREERNFSEETARAMDEEVRAIIDSLHERALEIISKRRSVLDALVEQLLERETLEEEDLQALLRQDARAEEKAGAYVSAASPRTTQS
ncbi:MAG: hypothetical protein ACE5JI_00520 [Acidobacteriota bacterium]